MYLSVSTSFYNPSHLAQKSAAQLDLGSRHGFLEKLFPSVEPASRLITFCIVLFAFNSFA